MTDISFNLRVPTYDDLWIYTGFLADPEVSIWLEDECQTPVTFSDVEAFVYRQAWCVWSVESGGEFIGFTGFSHRRPVGETARFFIVLGNQKFLGQGLGTAVTRRVVHRGFQELGLRRIVSDYLHPNKGSAILHERAGFRIEGRLRQDAWRRGQWVDRILLSILRSEYAT